MFGLVFVSDGQNEGPFIMALIFVAQLALGLLLSGIISVCYTCTSMVKDKLWPHSFSCQLKRFFNALILQ